MREGWPVAAEELLIKTSGGRRRVMVSTIAVRGSEPPFYLHVMTDGLELPEPATSPEGSVARLTRRQAEVLELMGAGASAKVISGRLGIAEATVRNHIRAILVELGCHSQIEALAEARRRKLIT